MAVKMKRKDLDEIYDEFSDFSLSSPARKIRRLDMELPPIIEEGPGFPAGSEPPLPDELLVDINNCGEQLTAPITEPIPSVPLNEERSLVLYKPVNTFAPAQMFQSPLSPEISLRVNSDFLPGFNNQILWSGGSQNFVRVEETPVSMDEKPVANDCLAVVPWVPNQFSVTNPTMNDEGDASMAMEPMDTEETEAMVEDNVGVGGQETELTGMGLQQWQQHCMIPEPPQPATPVMWSL